MPKFYLQKRKYRYYTKKIPLTVFMVFHIVSLFPDSFQSHLNTSILLRARQKGLFEARFYNLADFSPTESRRVDDRPYGGFPGTVLKVEPLYNAITHIESQAGEPLEKIFFTPAGTLLTQSLLQKKVEKSAKDRILLCGHYE